MTGFKVLGINHLGLAAKDTEKCRWFFGEVLGLGFLGDELVREQQTMTSMFRSASGVIVGESRLELLSAADGSTDSPIEKFLAKKGAGIHHLALSVDNVEATIAAVVKQGVRMIDATPRGGAHHTLIAFVHPESTGGILVEFVQEQT
jgi:methylmalonyl-CoA/ethylmalonyl-CoA epimerase